MLVRQCHNDPYRYIVTLNDDDLLDLEHISAVCVSSERKTFSFLLTLILARGIHDFIESSETLERW